MFGSVKPPSTLVKFFCPQVSPHTVAKAVIAALDVYESRYIYLPFYTRFTWLMHIAPSWAKSLVYWVRVPRVELFVLLG
jgi:hypothetical protein